MSGLLRGWIGCLNSQEWCFRQRALYLCPLFRFVLPPLLCSCSATAVKGFSEGIFSRKVVFSPYSTSAQVNSHKHTHTQYMCIHTLLNKQKSWSVGRACSIICHHLLCMQVNVAVGEFFHLRIYILEIQYLLHLLLQTEL